ncbi:hypothetical protein CLIB1444_02S02256 [[Candida] jaroonii]|uniref:Uncharacterized protein n=1 Tax=[Candida] jaroonii TaxID=467808 RepID=A0ACA9Y3E3_9ASCO|nr:hypothetical protein CLIB1444_02S02256 [[Candida] jaroonii]
MDSSSKKRNRIPSSCSICRKRKSKCDRVKPVCGSCKKKSIAHLCYYETEKSNESYQPGFNQSPQYQSPTIQHPNQMNMEMQGHGHMNQGPMSQGPPPQGGQVPVQVHGQVPGQIPGQMPGPGQMPAPGQGGYPMGDPNVHMVPVNYTNGHNYGEYYPVQPPDNFEYDNNGMPIIRHGSNPPPPPPAVHHPPQPLQSQHLPPASLQSPQQAQPSPNNQPPPPPASINIPGIPIQPRGVSPMPPPPHTFNHRQPNGPIPPPPNGPPTPNNISMQTPSALNDNTYSSNASSATSSVKLPPIKNIPSSTNSLDTSPRSGSEQLITVPIGPTSSLKINPQDEVTDFFSNASTPLSLEGSYLQTHGFSSYVGLTKSDKYVKFLRDFAVHLITNGEITQFASTTPKRKAGESIAPSPKKVKPEIVESTTKNDAGIKDNTTNSVVKDETNEGLQNNDGGDDDEANDDEGNDDDIADEEDEKARDDAAVLAIVNNNLGNSKKSDSLAILPGLKTLYSGKSNRKEYYKLVEQAILKVLPSKNQVSMLFQRYYKWVNPFIPIVNENTMRNDFCQLVDRFPSSSSEKYQSLNIKNDKHLSIMALMLLMCRLGYMSFIHNQSVNNQYNDKEASIIQECKKVPYQLFNDVVNLCIPDENTSYRSTLRNIQTLCLLYFYREVSPNDCLGVGSADSQILFGSIVQQALSMGLNRDPLKYIDHETINSNKDLIETWRNLWFHISNLDASQSIHRMSTLCIYNGNISDNKLPNVHIKNEDLKQLNLTINEVSKIYRRISLIINDFSKNPKIVDILKETNTLEHIFFNYFGKDFFSDSICIPAIDQNFEPGSIEHDRSFIKVMKFLIFMQVRTDLSSIYYVISMHYESNSEKYSQESMSSGVELFKIHFKSVVQLSYIMSYVFDNTVELFGRNYDYILTAHMERFMIKTHSFLTSFFIRLIAQKQLLTIKQLTNPEESSAIRLEAFDRTFNMVLMESEYFVGNFRTLSLRYLNSYKIYVLTYYVLKQCMENPEIFFQYSMNDTSIFEDGSSVLDYFTAEEMNYLTRLMEELRYIKNIQAMQKRQNLSSVSSAKSSNHGSPEMNRTNSNLPQHHPKKPNVDPSSVAPSISSSIPNSTNNSLADNEEFANPARQFASAMFRPGGKFESDLLPSSGSSNASITNEINHLNNKTSDFSKEMKDPIMEPAQDPMSLLLSNLAGLNNLAGSDDIRTDDFMKLFELYGEGANDSNLE